MRLKPHLLHEFVMLRRWNGAKHHDWETNDRGAARVEICWQSRGDKAYIYIRVEELRSDRRGSRHGHIVKAGVRYGEIRKKILGKMPSCIVENERMQFQVYHNRRSKAY